jgi:hypothetical protein
MIYYIKNKEANNRRTLRYYHNNYKTNYNYRISRLIRGRLYKALRARNLNKSGKSISPLLGCSIEMLKKYLISKFTKGMTWEDLMNGRIHIDHIKPLVLFNLESEEEQKIAFHYTNLQPLWAKDNLHKGISYG